MKRYTEDEYLMLSGIQHFVFCRRQWALIHIEQQWEENIRTVDGHLMHQKAHDADFREKRGKVIITRGMAVASPWLGIYGNCDIVEFHESIQGIQIHGLESKYLPIPVEYKKGSPKTDLSDKMQLAAQAMCLEDMLCCTIEKGYLFYGETRRREEVEIDESLREAVRKTVEEMHQLFQRGYTPKVRRSKACNACSLKNICLPVLQKKSKVSAYMQKRLNEENSDEKIT